MSMTEKPAVSLLPDGGKYWTHDYEHFSVLVYVPEGDPRADVINFGFKAPYLLVFGDPERSIANAVEFAERRGLADIARQHSSSVVYVSHRLPFFGGLMIACNMLLSFIAQAAPFLL